MSSCPFIGSASASDTTGAVIPVETAAAPPADPVGSERSREADMTHVLIYVAGFLLWPILFGALARRLLGVEVGRVRRALSGLAGIGVGAVMSNAVTGGAWGIWNFIAYVIFAVLGTLAAVALLDFLVRPATLGHLQQSFGPVPHPVRAARRRVARGRRYAAIISAFRRHGLLSTLSRRNGGTTSEHRHARERRLGTQLSLALQEASGVFVKLGQVLSTRPDVLGEHAAEQLSVLQDRVAPADQAAVERLLRAELGRPVDEVFERFDTVPLAAASIGQVHRARLRSGPEVVVKVQRPGVEELVERDLDIILALARRLDATAGRERRVGAADLAQGFAENLRQELDYTIEARNTRIMRELIERRARLRVPQVFGQLSTRRVLVLEFIDGTPLRDAGALLANLDIQRVDLARCLLETFLAQVLEAGMVNADPHPGNVLLLADGTLAQIDFGSVVRLHATQRLALVRLLMAVDRQDPELLRDALLELTTPGPGRDLDTLDRALAGFLTQRLGPGTRPGAEMFNDLLALASRFGLAFDPQLAGVFRALITLEGTLRVLDPEFAIIEEARPLAEKAGQRAFGPGAFSQAAGEDLLKVAPLLRRMPGRLDRITWAMERNEWGYNIRLLAHEDDRRLAQRFFGRAILAFLSAAIGLVSALLIGVSNGISVATGVPLAQALGYLGLVIATVLGMRVLIAIIRDRVI
jgi:ubiquinone biosynthesis protein